MSVSVPILNTQGDVIATITNSTDNAIINEYISALDQEQQKTEDTEKRCDIYTIWTILPIRSSRKVRV